MKNFFFKILSILSIFLIIFCNISYCEELSSEKVIYLTFDDGPTKDVTNQILDILKYENVPATFFVIGNLIENNEDIILRMKNENHSIGLHSYTHERKNLYENEENFLKEMLMTQNELFEITNEKHTILRFPFGCNNITYKLKQSLVDKLHENNLKIYDWHIDSGDGENPNISTYRMLKNSISDKNNINLLMHCGSINKNSATTLPEIIKYYKEQGYTFSKITENTPEIYKIIKK